MSGSLEGVYEPGIVDPGIPVDNPTNSFWLSSPHPLANHQSPWPTSADIVIIGSGISGTSIAHTVTSKRPDLNVVLVDARSLCSGATARNGGHIKTMAFAVWENRKRAFGIEEAIKITAFEHSHLKVMTDAIREHSLDCNLVATDGIDAYYDQKTFEKAVAALGDMRAHTPDLADLYKVHTDRNTLQVMKLSARCVGAIAVPAASVWPYKMVTGLIASMVESGLNVQTNTKVHAIDEKEDFAIVHTNRGDINVKHVVHATNGWMGHLLPELRPFLSPVRGNVVRYGQNAVTGAETVSPMGINKDYSFWLRYAEKDYDYLIQRAQGDVVVGRANCGRKATGDDSETDLQPQAHLRGFPDEAFLSPSRGSSALITHAWSGILGFTQDAMPFVGRLPFPGRSHQWVCGGYHGIGMIKAFRTGQMAALMILGEPLSDEYPRSMLVTEKRVRTLRKSLDSTKAKL
ncbi:FAD dependent oxidoreductase [Dactylonectria macrodidyma]|uniref:FAD dependent oxidoreductase n=1 Tax=Dactylonectria macrodidyma TaxID=307937 RepID=A0A9P9JDP8_9HYPO|nr:FAD dependent oxidoreductase [Dactylonectria macrodidyma]